MGGHAIAMMVMVVAIVIPVKPHMGARPPLTSHEYTRSQWG